VVFRKKTDLTALEQQVHVSELLKLQADWHRPVAMIQMMNDVWNLNSKLHVEIGFAKPNVSFLSLGLRNLDISVYRATSCTSSVTVTINTGNEANVTIYTPVQRK